MRIELTQDQIVEIVSRVIEALQTNSKAIKELTLVSEVSNDDYIEISEGKRIAVTAIVDSVASRFDEDSITEEMLQALCVTAAKIAVGAVTNEKIADGSITLAKLANDVFGTITAGSTGFVTGNDAAQAILWQRGNGQYSAIQKGSEGSANGALSLSEGNNNHSSGNFSHAEGKENTSSGQSSHAEGTGNVASGKSSHAEGSGNTVSKEAAHVEGYNNTVSKNYAHAEGAGNVVDGAAGHAEGAGNTVNGTSAHAEGESNTANGNMSHTEGSGNRTNGNRSHAEGKGNLVGGADAHAEGDTNRAMGNQSHAEGHFTESGVADDADNTHTEGYATVATGMAAHAEGGYGCASTEFVGDRRLLVRLTGEAGATSFRVTNFTELGVNGNLLQGKKIVYGSDEETDVNVLITGVTVNSTNVCTITTDGPLSESALNAAIFYLAGNTADGVNAHAEGNFNRASGTDSHAEGHMNVASGRNSHAEGSHNIAENENEHVEGTYNFNRTGLVHSVGIGSDDDSRMNAEEIDETGKKFLRGVGGFDGTNGGQNDVRDVAKVINGNTAMMGYAVCSTPGDNLTKQISLPNFPAATSGVTGGCFKVKMEHANTAEGDVKLLVNGVAAISILYNGEAVSDTNTWEDGEVLSVYFDGEYYQATNVQGGSGSAEKVSYNNTQSGYQNIDNAQDAIDKNAELIKELQASVFPLAVTLSVSGSGTREYTGENQSVNFIYTVKRQGQNVTPSRLTMTVGSVTTTIANPSASGTLTVPGCGKGTTSVSITAYYGSLNKSASASVSFIAPVLITNTPRSEMSSAELEQAQGWSVKSSAAGTYTMSPASDFYLWICVPAGKSITKVTSSGFDVPMERQSGNVSVVTVNGNEYEESYVCYRSSAKLIAGSWTFVVS